MNEEIGKFKGKRYRKVTFESTNSEDTECNKSAFELGKCRVTTWVIG